MKIPSKPKGSIKARSGKIYAEIKSCTELKSILKKGIRAKVKDATLAKELETMFQDMLAYGAGDLPCE